MTAPEILDHLRCRGMRVRADGSRLIVAPRDALTDELRGLIRQNKAALLAAIASPAGPGPEAAHIRMNEMMREFADGLRAGCLVACERCAEFVSRPNQAPDGWCQQFQAETWSRLPFRCAQYREH